MFGRVRTTHNGAPERPCQVIVPVLPSVHTVEEEGLDMLCA